jgi:hypothetical protein
MRQSPHGLRCRFGAFIHECWGKMRVMKAASGQAESGDGARSHEPSEERLHDQQA